MTRFLKFAMGVLMMAAGAGMFVLALRDKKPVPADTTVAVLIALCMLVTGLAMLCAKEQQKCG